MQRLAVLAVLAFSPLAQAQEVQGAYFGAHLGALDYEERGGNDPSLPTVSDTVAAYGLTGGYRFNDHVAVELGLGHTSDIKSTFTEDFVGIGPLTVELAANFDIYSLMALGYLPFDALSLFAGAGYFSASVGGEARVPEFDAVIGSVSGHERGATAAVGLQRDLGLDLKSLSIRAQYQWYDIDEVDAAELSIGVLYRF